MEFKISVAEMHDVMTRLNHVIKINEDGITGMFLVEVDNDGVRFKSTDGNVSLVVDSEKHEIIKPGRELIRLRDVKGYLMKFEPLVGDYGTENFHFIIEGGLGLIKTKTQFPSSKPSYRRLKFETFKLNFPAIKIFEDAQLIVNSTILKRGITRVLHCINPAEVRKSMTGLHIAIRDDKIVFAGTNGVKLAEFEVDMHANIKRTSDVWRYGFASILSSILNDDAQVFIRFEGGHVYVKFNNVYLIGSLILGENFPDYRSKFSLENVIRFPRVGFTDTVRSVMDVLDPEDNSRLTINFAGNKLILKNDRMDSVQDFDEDFGAELDVDVNGEYLDSLLRDFIGDILEIRFTKGSNYLVFKSPDSDKHTALLTVVNRR